MNIDSELFEKISQEYGIGTLEHIEKVEKGVLSQNWFITSSGRRYFLKKYRFNNEKRVQEVHEVKQFFAKHSIPVILPINTREGETYLKSGDMYFALFPFIGDRQLERGKLSDTAIVSMGKMLGRMHQAGKESTLDIDKEGFKVWDLQTFSEDAHQYLNHIDQISDPTAFDKLARNDLELKLSLVTNDQRQYAEFNLPSNHLIHGDYLDHNLFFNEADEVSYVFDLEKSQYTARSCELLRSLLYSIMEPEITEQSMHRAKVYMAAYQKVYPIPGNEISKGMEVFFLKSIRNLWICKEMYVLENRRPGQFLLEDMARIRFLAEHRTELVDTLMGTERDVIR